MICLRRATPLTFATALTDLLSGGTGDDLGDRIAKLNIPGAVKYELLTLLRESDGEAKTFCAAVEGWFNDTMARISGWHKRSTQITLIVIAVVLTLGLNANSITLAERLWTDPAVRAAVVQEATSSGLSTGPSQGTAQAKLDSTANEVNAVAKLGLPIGWTGNRSEPTYVSLTSAGNVVRTLLGWLLTIVALSLSAPCWFDVLSRAARLRSTGTQPSTSAPATTTA